MTGRFVWNTLSPPDVLSINRATSSEDSTRFKKTADELWNEEFGGETFARKEGKKRKVVRKQRHSNIKCDNCDKWQENCSLQSMPSQHQSSGILLLHVSQLVFDIDIAATSDRSVQSMSEGRLEETQANLRETDGPPSTNVAQPTFPPQVIPPPRNGHRRSLPLEDHIARLTTWQRHGVGHQLFPKSGRVISVTRMETHGSNCYFVKTGKRP